MYKASPGGRSGPAVSIVLREELGPQQCAPVRGHLWQSRGWSSGLPAPHPGFSPLPHQAQSLGMERNGQMQEQLRRENGQSLVTEQMCEDGKARDRLPLRVSGLASGVLSWEHARRRGRDPGSIKP